MICMLFEVELLTDSLYHFFKTVEGEILSTPWPSDPGNCVSEADMQLLTSYRRPYTPYLRRVLNQLPTNTFITSAGRTS